jgi:hypothetical protein
MSSANESEWKEVMSNMEHALRRLSAQIDFLCRDNEERLLALEVRFAQETTPANERREC